MKLRYPIPVGYLMNNDRIAKTDVLQGTLILLVLRTLEALGPLHGYGIARRIEQISIVRHSANLFPLLGIQPLRGRFFSAEEAEQRLRLAVISYRFFGKATSVEHKMR